MVEFTKYGERINPNSGKKRGNKIIHQVIDGAQIELVLDEQTKTWMAKCQDKLYPVFTKENGLATFEDSTGHQIYYDSRIPVKEGEEPIREGTNEENSMIKFGPNHEYEMPFSSQNGEYYTQMRYENGRTINIGRPGAKSIFEDPSIKKHLAETEASGENAALLTKLRAATERFRK